MKQFVSGKSRLFLAIGCLVVAAALVLSLTVGLQWGSAYTGETILRFSVGEPFNLCRVEEAAGNGRVNAQDASPASVAIQEGESLPSQTELAPTSGVKEDFEVRISRVDSYAPIKDAVLSSLEGNGIFLSSNAILAGEESLPAGGWAFTFQADSIGVDEAKALVEASLQNANCPVRQLVVTENDPAEDEARMLVVSILPDDPATALAESLLAELAPEYPNLQLVSILTTQGSANPCDLIAECAKVLACAAVLLFLYTWVRHQWTAAAASVISMLLNAVFASALVLAVSTFIPLTPSFVCVVLAACIGSTIRNLALLDWMDVLTRKTDNAASGKVELLSTAMKTQSYALIFPLVAAVAVLLGIHMAERAGTFAVLYSIAGFATACLGDATFGTLALAIKGKRAKAGEKA